jgi:hypothetical protein
MTFKDTTVKDMAALNLEGNIEATLADDVVVSTGPCSVVLADMMEGGRISLISG